MTALLKTLAGGKVVVALEGGYNLASISRSMEAVVRALLGDPAPTLERPIKQGVYFPWKLRAGAAMMVEVRVRGGGG
jgi:acetoin utilization deacetylase AcuC-like enzyme